ncbi:uncharacterized protein ACA1_244910 [Acanthamoeba castellanii str. Neff]|uniref:Uncharacterized protein n=1 Tax=Acanthamoeba castellanii (strain ATCC 30010 / Neff) TaxID=1257118 RepID=L8GMJ5_ACACF|nr:uncharacterized protein ACA1_244910 [Acanthamoeba castellanii str. Neff]ELR13441.1 hypothetical protein ACA1_244910 [Acanthamoeba castellanii str. Neff]
MALKVITGLGWHINHEKSLLVPSQLKEFLGLTIDMTGEPCFWVPMGKAHALKHDIERLLCAHDQDGQVLVRWAVVVAGHCCSLMSWNSHIHLSDVAQNDLWEWMAGMATWDGRLALMRPFDMAGGMDAAGTSMSWS